MLYNIIEFLSEKDQANLCLTSKKILKRFDLIDISTISDTNIKTKSYDIDTSGDLIVKEGLAPVEFHYSETSISGEVGMPSYDII
jgi:hypothetical protein